MLDDIFKKNTGSLFLLGNEAIARGALEAGIQFVTTYPGTPASEIGDTFAQIVKQNNKIYFEYSVNEKVALEAAAGAAFCGLKSLVAMKHFGLNVASDFLIPLMYSGTNAGLVLVVADDPGCSSSAQSEQDSRAFSYLAHLPTLEPATPQECKDFTKKALAISEAYKIPVMIRQTTRVALQGGIVKLNKIQNSQKQTKFIKNPRQFVTMPPRVLEMKKELLTKIKQIQKRISEKGSLNKIYHNKETKNSQIGIITSGVCFLYAIETLKKMQANISVLKLDFFYPLPEKKIEEFIKNLKTVLIIEETEDYLEKEIRAIVQKANIKVEIVGKKYLPKINELNLENINEAIAQVDGHKIEALKKQNKTDIDLKRQPQLCPGCPYWLVFQAVKNVVDTKKVIFGGEIGCYMLAGLKPHQIQDYLFCMGSSVGIAHGIKKASKQKLIAFVGDSSFFHAGIPALINSVHNNSNPLIIILDNQTTAMTGYQPRPKIKIENIIQACGVKNLKVIDPVNIKKLQNTIKNFIKKSEVSVIIARHPCKFINKS